MVGIHLFHHAAGIAGKGFSAEKMLTEGWHRKREYIYNEFLYLAASFYEGYPVIHYEDDDVLVVYEGIIYNRTNEEVFSFCRSLAEPDPATGTPSPRIALFVDASDGDFLLLVHHKKSGVSQLFNDSLGRLPLYYYADAEQCMAGRSFPFIIHHLPRICIKPDALTEFLMNEFLIGKNTLFEGVYRLAPAEMLVLKPAPNGPVISLHPTADASFATANPFKTRKEALDALHYELEQATKNRIGSLISRGYRIVNTLSGGFDSRAVFGMIRHFTDDFINVTYAYSQDESRIAKQLLDETGSRSDYVKLTFDNRVNWLDSPLMFRTGNGVNIYTASLCYNDNLFLKRELLQGRDAVFGGLGGEFIRHPYHPLPMGPYAYLTLFCATLPVRNLLPVFRVEPSHFRKYLGTTLQGFKEKRGEAAYRSLYFEYYRNYIVGAGEDRMRMFAWTVHPLMAAGFMRTIRKRVPLRWADFPFFTAFLSGIDPRLLEIPIFGKKVNLRDRRSIAKLTPVNQKPLHSLALILVKRFAWRAVRLLAQVRKYGWRRLPEHLNDGEATATMDHFDHFYRGMNFYKTFFNYPFIQKHFHAWPPALQNRMLSTAMFLSELENRYRNKLDFKPGTGGEKADKAY